MNLEKLTLDDVCELITCGVAKRPNYVTDGIPFLSAKNVKKQSIIWDDYQFISKDTHDELTKYNKPLKDDILYTRVGSYGEAAIIDRDDEFSIFVSLTLIKPSKKILNTYLTYYLNSPYIKNLAKKSISGSGVGNLNVGTVRKFPITLPSLATQQKIVEKLDAIFAEINKALEATETNIRNAEALFQNYLKENFDKENSEFVSLGSVCKVIAGQSPEGKYYNTAGNGLGFYQGKKDFGPTYINPPTVWTKEITKEALKDDILMSVRAPVGPVNIATERICIGRGLAAIRATDKINHIYLFKYLLKIEKELVGNTGAVFNSINKAQIENLKIPLPSLSIQKDIVVKINSVQKNIDLAISSYAAKFHELNNLKHSILRQLFNGEPIKAHI